MDCNLQCRYCYGKSIADLGQPFPFKVDYSLPSSISYDLVELLRFLQKDSEAVIIFYGGEPTIALDKMYEIMDNFSAKAYVLQTNGLLLDKLEKKYVKMLDTVFVSIDGDEATTNYYRGIETYRRVIENLKLFSSRDFRGELIARMTIDPETNLNQAVTWLLFNDDFSFKSVHWQLDAQFWRGDYDKEAVSLWFKRYNKDVQSLVKNWVNHMETKGEVLKIYPFIGVIESLLRGEATKLRCGAGWAKFNIQTDGKITPCPVMAGMKEYYLGNIWETHPSSLADSILVKEPCSKCSIYGLCGGRCLYANATQLWGDEGYQLTCGTVKHLIASLQIVQNRIEELISNGRITITDFAYMKYNGCEIIP